VSEWRELGRICRLQIQQSSLKVGPPKGRYFDPAPLAEVRELVLTADGVEARSGETVRLDVHNAGHPDSKNVNGINDVSVGFTGHYASIRDRFGTRIVNGIAGENILVEREGTVVLSDITGGLLITGEDGRRIELSGVRVAHPCVEFSRFVMGDPLAPPAAVSETLKFLDGGTRGFYAGAPDGTEVRVVVGDRLWGRVEG
jgi:hypothetical protein